MADNPEDHVTSPPVVTIMGHVDHGKTSLLDAIRETNVTATEAGGITQHIGAYQVDIRGRSIVFLDTPGHEAFTMMRARGAQATDIVVLVVAADDGVMPQTIEAIHHAKAANVPIIVAINKIDKPGAQIDRVKQALSDQGLLAEDWGGEIVTVPVSAKQKTNIDLLLEMILLVADMKDLQGESAGGSASGRRSGSKSGQGTGLRGHRSGSERHAGAGRFLRGRLGARARARSHQRPGRQRQSPPDLRCPWRYRDCRICRWRAILSRCSRTPHKARQVAEYRQAKDREQSLRKTSRLSLQALYEQMREGTVKELPLIVKGDVQGSVEVLTDMLNKLSTDKAKVKILHSGAGAITETDVLLASASNAIIIGFNVRPERKAQELADAEGVEIRLYTVIYNLSNDIKRAMIGMLEYTTHEKYVGRAEVRDTFKVPKFGFIAGSYVLDGIIRRNSEARLLRDNAVIHEGKIGSLRRFKDDVSEVKSGFECGIAIRTILRCESGRHYRSLHHRKSPAHFSLITNDELRVTNLTENVIRNRHSIRNLKMPIAYCTLELYLPYSQSLKEKRMVLRKAQDRLRARSNFSIAEVAYQDLWQRAKLAAVTVGADNAVLERVTQQFVREAENILEDLLIDCQVSFIEP